MHEVRSGTSRLSDRFPNFFEKIRSAICPFCSGSSNDSLRLVTKMAFCNELRASPRDTRERYLRMALSCGGGHSSAQSSALKQSGGHCEACGRGAPFGRKDGTACLEMGSSTVPNLPSGIHPGQNSAALNKSLQRHLVEIETDPL